MLTPYACILSTTALVLGSMAMVAPNALASSPRSNTHFTIKSLSLPSGDNGVVVQGTQTLDVTLSVQQTTPDNAGGENHAHALPATVQFIGQEGRQRITLTGTLTTSVSSTQQPDQVGSVFTGTYAIPLSSYLPKNITIPTRGLPFTLTTIGFTMDYPNGSADRDDPTGCSASLEGKFMPAPPPVMPEVPYAAILPGVLLLGGLGVYGMIRKKASHS